MVDRRNADFHDLGKRLRFDTGSSYDADGNASFQSPLSVYESDVLVWMVGELTKYVLVGSLLMSFLFTGRSVNFQIYVGRDRLMRCHAQISITEWTFKTQMSGT